MSFAFSLSIGFEAKPTHFWIYSGILDSCSGVIEVIINLEHALVLLIRHIHIDL